MMDGLLIDTDVLLDFLFDRRPHSNHTTQNLEHCRRNKVKGFTTPLSIANMYYLLRKVAKHEIVISKISQLLNLIDVLSMDKSVVISALNSNFRDFEDALQHYSASQTSRVNVIITRNAKDYKHSNITVLTPELYLNALHSR